LQVLANYGQHDARHTPAGAYVEYHLLRLQELGEGQAVDQVAGDELLVSGVPRQVELGVPLPEQFAVAIQQSYLGRRQLDLMPGQRPPPNCRQGYSRLMPLV